MDVQKAQGTVDFVRAQIAEAEASRAVKVRQAEEAQALAQSKVDETDRIIAALAADLAIAEAALIQARADAEDAPPALHQAGGEGAAFNATIVTDES